MTETVSSPNNSGKTIKSKRVSTGSIGAQAGASVTVTWDSPFETANYTVATDINYDSTIEAGLRVLRIRFVTTNSCTITVWNNTLGALTGLLHVIAIAD